MKPGSEEELKELVATSGHACPDDHYVAVICEMIKFPFRVRQTFTAEIAIRVVERDRVSYCAIPKCYIYSGGKDETRA
jgi:hypothetical protein